MTARIEFPDDLYPALLSIWRSDRRGRSAGGRGGAPEGRGAQALSRDELAAVSRNVRDLSRGLTRDRALAGERYLSDPDLLGAYLLHFWPVSYAEARLCLEMMRTEREGTPFASALEIGAGPGAMSVALLEAGAREVLACDRSGAALSLARRIASARGRRLQTFQWDATKSTGMPTGAFDVIALGHTLNELWPANPERIALRVSLIERLGQRLAPDGRLLIVEPALMKTAQEAIQVRDGLVQKGFTVEAPCIWQGACPALPNGTCHGEFAWQPPREMVRLAHAARIGRESLKMAWFVLRRAPVSVAAGPPVEPGPRVASTPDAGLYRVVSEPLLSKSGRIRYLVCGPLGRFALSAPKACSAPGMKAFPGLKRGDLVRFHGAGRRETGWGLDDRSQIEVVARAPRALSGRASP
jgi:SAM-dependent methyltransferase